MPLQSYAVRYKYKGSKKIHKGCRFGTSQAQVRETTQRALYREYPDGYTILSIKRVKKPF